MAPYYRMTRMEKSDPGASAPAGMAVIPYDAAQHRGLVPQLYAASFGEPAWPDDWDAIPEFDPAGVFLAQAQPGGEYAGFVVSFRRRNFGYISVVGVLPQWRRRGIAGCLIAAAGKYLLAHGAKYLQIDVDVVNEAGRLAYEKLGFKVIERKE